MKISTFIVTYNRIASVRKALDQNVRNNGNVMPWDELIWVDNGTSEELLPLVEDYGPDALLIHKENMGVSKGYNRAKALCTGDWILDLGDRNILPVGCFKAMVAVAATDEVDAICAYEGEYALAPERHLPGDAREFAGIRCLPGIAFSSILFRRSLLSTAGYFREDMGMYGWNDVEWASRLKIRNARTFVIPEFIVERVPDEPGYQMPGHEQNYRAWRDACVNDPNTKAVLGAVEKQGYPYYNPFA